MFAFAYLTFVFVLLVIIGTALYWLDVWMDTDKAQTTTARHRA